MSNLVRRLVDYWPVTVALVGVPLVALLLYGCESRQTVVIEGSDDQDAAACATLLATGLDMARPESMGLLGADVTLTSDAAAAATTLSSWLRRPDCLAASPAEPVSEEAKALIARLLGTEGAERATADRVSAFDAGHIREALLDFSAADALSQGADGDLGRTMRVFDYVVRTVTPEGEGSIDLSLTPYELHLFGRGSSEGRAWLFANLLRQLRIDAVVLRPSGEAKGDPWWVGALLDDGVYLFDLVLGLPVPAGEDSAGESLLPTPATWVAAVAEPELLTAYRRDAGMEAESIPADRLAMPRVELIGSSAFWGKAMERIELSMTEDRGVLLYDPLHDTQAGPGLLRRVTEAGGSAWNDDAISVWPYTEQVRVERAELSESQQQRLQQRIRPYLGPVEIDYEGATPTPQPPSKALWETRIEQMHGRPGSAIGSYLQVRRADTAEPLLSPADQSLNALAADEAHYWIAHAQYGAGLYDAAAATAASYAENGDRSDEAAALRVLALAAEGKRKEAAAAVAELPETTPGLTRLQWLARWWMVSAEGQ